MIVAFLLCSTGMFAQTTTNKTEMVSIPKDQLTEQQKMAVAAQNTKESIEAIGKYAGIGKEVGEAVNNGLSALTHQVDTFANTKVGKFTMFMIAYKIMGKDIIQMCVGFPFLLFTIIFSVIYYCQNIKNKRVVKSETCDAITGKVIDKEYETLECENELKWGWIVISAIFIGVSFIIILA